DKWLPVSPATAVPSCPETLPLPGPAGDQENQENYDDDSIIPSAALEAGSHSRFSNHFQHPCSHLRSCPLPLMSWADAQDVWHAMLENEGRYSHSMFYVFSHPELRARMRTELFQWLMRNLAKAIQAGGSTSSVKTVAVQEQPNNVCIPQATRLPHPHYLCICQWLHFLLFSIAAQQCRCCVQVPSLSLFNIFVCFLPFLSSVTDLCKCLRV
ncbi:hypothetical protein BaRGS_00003017, partial [Batillaria attramentaria]